jgi:hypothetical protein
VRNANHHIKLSLGFGAQPEIHVEDHQDVYFNHAACKQYTATYQPTANTSVKSSLML